MPGTAMAQKIAQLKELLQSQGRNEEGVLCMLFEIFKLSRGGPELQEETIQWLNEAANTCLSPPLLVVLNKLFLEASQSQQQSTAVAGDLAGDSLLNGAPVYPPSEAGSLAPSVDQIELSAQTTPSSSSGLTANVQQNSTQRGLLANIPATGLSESMNDFKKEDTLFENRCTLSHLEGGLTEKTWFRLGRGNLKVVYDFGLGYFRIICEDDIQRHMCDAIIAIETKLKVHQNECTWSSVDYMSDECCTFRVQFCSPNEALKLKKTFAKGKMYAQKLNVHDESNSLVAAYDYTAEINSNPRELIYSIDRNEGSATLKFILKQDSGTGEKVIFS